MAVLHPALIVCIGGLAHSRFLPGRRLEEIVGHAWSAEGAVVGGIPASTPALLPLPHPSGQSRWLNDPGHVRLLDSALERLRALAVWAEATAA
jgi:uracil-DNA glycosylase